MVLGISVCGETCQFPAGGSENTLQVLGRARARPALRLCVVPDMVCPYGVAFIDFVPLSTGSY